MLRSLQGEQMYGRNGMIEIYTDQESDFIHLLQNKQAQVLMSFNISNFNI